MAATASFTAVVPERSLFAVVSALDPGWQCFSAPQFGLPKAAGQSVPTLDCKRESFGCRQVRQRVLID